MSERKRVLVVEDEATLLLGLVENLTFAGYDVLQAIDGPSACETALREHPDALLLDIMLPGFSGFEVCRRLREEGLQMPIIMLTARGDEFDKLHGFEMGADDYVTKPFSVDELLARLKAVLLRGERQASKPRKLAFADVVLDLDARTMTRAGKDVVVTRTEFDLLVYFVENEGKALSRDTVMTDVWGLEYFGTQRSLDSFVANLRKKIEKDPHHPVHIHTVHGVGYKFLSGENGRPV